MADIFYTNEQRNVYPRRQYQSRQGFDNIAAEAEERAQNYVWPESEMNYNNGGHCLTKSSESRGPMDDCADSIQLKSPKKMNDVKRLKDTENGAVSINSSQRSTSSTQPKSGVRQAFIDYAEKCSLIGVPFINGYRDIRIKMIWSFLLLISIGVMMFHLSKLFTTYFSYEKHSKIKFGFSNLLFPAVTFCNVNALRMSKLDNASKNIRELVEAVAPSNLRSMAKEWKPNYTTDSQGGGSQTNKQRDSNFLDSMQIKVNFTTSNDDKNIMKEMYPDSWESEADDSSFDNLQEMFRDEWVEMDPNSRKEIGHQLLDMVIQCSFAGGQCLWSNFSHVSSANYGNCYTLQYNKFITRRSGPENGLQLILYLETDEYIPVITSSKGIHLVIHEQGTVAFPDSEGIAVAAGSQTLIGLRKLEISRLGQPYGACTDPDDFMTKYAVKYTRTTCQQACLQVQTMEKCQCFDDSSQQINAILKIPSTMHPCDSDAESRCALMLAMNFEADSSACNCNSPCNETQFQKTISSRQWPTYSFATVMADAICQEIDDEECEKLLNKSESDLNEEFIKLSIYFEDLNYEELSEAADYELTQFLSDVGGTIGLYIGLSVLGVFELFHLLADIFRYCCCSRGKKVEQVRYG